MAVGVLVSEPGEEVADGVSLQASQVRQPLLPCQGSTYLDHNRFGGHRVIVRSFGSTHWSILLLGGRLIHRNGALRPRLYTSWVGRS